MSSGSEDEENVRYVLEMTLNVVKIEISGLRNRW